jgi:tRNA pseudouridine55 synthase
MRWEERVRGTPKAILLAPRTRVHAMKSQSVDGLLVVDKPARITSRDAVDRAAQWFPRRTRLGHTGTLDPLATGVLVLCVGAATRLTEYIQRMPKTYQAGLLLGARSDTDDADGDVQIVNVDNPPSTAQITEALRGFVGKTVQVPPVYSAAKTTGRRAYALARRGEEVNLQPREVQIYRIDVHHFDYPHLQTEVRCGKGTYVRSLARDLGRVLGCGAIVEKLRRTSVGPFTVSTAVDLDADATEARSRLLPLRAAVAELPSISLTLDEIAHLRQGKAVPRPGLALGKGLEIAVLDRDGNLAAIARVQDGGLLQPARVLRGIS